MAGSFLGPDNSFTTKVFLQMVQASASKFNIRPEVGMRGKGTTDCGTKRHGSLKRQRQPSVLLNNDIREVIEVVEGCKEKTVFPREIGRSLWSKSVKVIGRRMDSNVLGRGNSDQHRVRNK